MNRPTRCIDPVMKFCQECRYGSVIYPDWVETYEDTQGCCFETRCDFNLENTIPTQKEIEEVERWFMKNE